MKTKILEESLGVVLLLLIMLSDIGSHLPICKIIVEALSKKLSKDELLQTLATVSRELHLGSKNFSKELLAWLDGLEFGLKF